MVGPGGSWKLKISAEFKAGLKGANSLYGKKDGTLYIELNDGTKYVINEGEL